ncbi:hypothetical protein M758_UG160600 [Ceratodon purpureus]|nr:hypothetical protein M758_UG160600 [Ceratodon purpureus]KAG0595360.1 hypothetical protein M758_UG160600 [Ceratodon purpureus]
MASWEIVVCDRVLTELLSRLTRRPNTWDGDWVGAAGEIPHSARVIQDLENARLASPLWRDIIDESPEWAMIRLSRWDYSNELGVVWEPYDDYVVNRFFLSWETFNTSWTMATPIACPRIRKDPVGWLTEAELPSSEITCGTLIIYAFLWRKAAYFDMPAAYGLPLVTARKHVSVKRYDHRSNGFLISDTLK